ncbi:10279_t:CDS:2, partial [Funneliformis mosseae]
SYYEFPLWHASVAPFILICINWIPQRILFSGIQMGSKHNSIDIDSIYQTNSPISSYVISPDLNHVGTSHEDGRLAIWEVDDNSVKMVGQSEKVAFNNLSLFGLSNNKLMIFGQKLFNMETFKEITIRPRPTDGSYLRLLPNGDLLLLQIPYIYIYSEASLKKSTTSPCSYTSSYYFWGIEKIKIDHIVQINERMYFTLVDQNILFELNFEMMSIENYYIIPNSENIVIGSSNCDWVIAVNSEESLI